MTNTYNCTSYEAITKMVKKQIAVAEAYFNRAAEVLQLKSHPNTPDQL